MANESPAPEGGCWQLTVAYDGGAFWGSQRQPNRRTVQSVLEQALSDLAGVHIGTVFAGRTDRGVHAMGQAVSCARVGPVLCRLGDLALTQAVNARLPVDVAVAEVRRRPVGFHARYDAIWREYRYRVWCGGPQPLARHTVWQRARGLDRQAMEAAAAMLIGRHDFAAFASGGVGVPWSTWRERPRGTVRTVLRCSVRPVPPMWELDADGPGEGYEIRVVADGFLPRMVRGIVGALVEIGRGARPVEWMGELRQAADRRGGPPTAPAHGLVLWRIGYDDDVPAADEITLRATG
ncbi:MAG: tRNA pseudouridine(38-40) synthase TruA [Chloroflexia bacterium]|nr:tRNA pseudouridine(38-40) synthase TruA [Chloroflexia bacterium]